MHSYKPPSNYLLLPLLVLSFFSSSILANSVTPFSAMPPLLTEKATMHPTPVNTLVIVSDTDIDEDAQKNTSIESSTLIQKPTAIEKKSKSDFDAYQLLTWCLFIILLVVVFFWHRHIKKETNSLNKRYQKLKAIKNNIKENETRLERALSYNEIGNWEIDVADMTARCSSIYNQIFGYDSTEPQWTYALLLEHIHPEDRYYVAKKFKLAIRNKTNINYECRITRKDGVIRWVLGSGGQELNSDGAVSVISGIVQDITERKQTEMVKSQHHAELKSIFNALPDIYFKMTPDGIIVDYHAQHEKYLFLEPKDFIGKKMQSILPSDIGYLFQETLDGMNKAKETVAFKYQLKSNNEVLHFEARLNKIGDGKHIICVIRDINEVIQSTASLAASEQRFRSVFEQAAIGVALVNIDSGQFIRVNQRFADMVGYEIEELANGKTFNDITHPDDLQKNTAYVNEIKSNTAYQAINLKKRYIHKKGHIIWVEVSIAASQKTEQNSAEIIAVVRDISESKKYEEDLKLAANVFTYAVEGIIITDAKAIIIDVNGSFTTTTGYTREEAIGKNPNFLRSDTQSREFYQTMWQSLIEKGYWSGEIWNRRKNNELYAEMLNISSVKDENGQVSNYVGLFTDITLMKEHQEQLEHTAHYDLLTNLPNRSLLSDRLSQAKLHSIRNEKSLAVVFLDLDGFKAVNDQHGHDVGDQLLIALSIRMKDTLRGCDTLARIGGDEFVAVLADLTEVKDCKPVLERLLKATSEPIVIDDIMLHISASIGVTIYPQDDVDADLLMRHADQAMYSAKESGKNQYHLFDTAQDDAIKIQRENLETIRSALDNKQFILYYQPKVNMRTGTVIGVEALIRWQHPIKGLLNPIDFLPVIENHPMSIEMGEWVIDTALTQIGQWKEMGIVLPVSTSVNIAAAQIQQPDFTEKLAKKLAEHPDVAPQNLELEVLETSALDDVHHVSKIMEDCIALGVNFALDDFGTGYSSLTYLRRLPANLIKIDQSFVRDMLHDADDFAIVEGVIALAKSFKREVIAEGVETVEHGTALLQLGCELAQGYGIAKPMPATEIPAWVKNWQPDESWQ